ncbi:MAG: Flp pilus assembly complex ATPase component TadA [Deltaproteobacteria bacterium]|nr:Flp pilus assembly complex ATPase component TadA [Deltaproteobacteria bacterium]
MGTFQITIAEKGGQTKNLDFEKSEVTIGRVQGNDVVLPKGNISKRHSRIVLKDGKFIIIDMQSTNGTYVNGKKITTPQVVKSTDKIYIGDFTLQLSPLNGTGSPAPEPAGAGAAARGHGAPDEIDLGDQADESAPRGGAAPGLIDENFDQEFEGTSEPEPARKAAGSAGRAKPAPKVESGELDLDLGGGSDNFAAAPPEVALDEEPKKPARAPLKSPAPSKAAAVAPPIARSKPSPAKTPLPAKIVTPEVEDRPHVIVPPPPPAAVTTGGPMVVAPQAATAVVAGAPALSRREAIETLQIGIARELGLRSVSLASLHDHEGRAMEVARRLATQLVSSGRAPAGEPVEMLAHDAVRATFDVAAIADLVGDETVHEIVLTHQGELLAERDGQLGSIGRSVANEVEAVALIRRLAVLAGAADPHQQCTFDLRLRDGARLVATLPPLAFRGPTMSIRKTAREAFTLDALMQHGTLGEAMMRFIEHCIRYRKGVLLSAGPGVGGSATLNALAAVVPGDERLMAIENGVELHLMQSNVISVEPSGKLGLSALVRHAVAVQPERVLIGWLAGSAVKDVISAANGPLDGTIACAPGASPADALDRLAREMSGTDLDAAKRAIARAFPVVVQEHRFADGSRRITQIAELHVDGDAVSVEDVFTFEVEGVDDGGLITGTFKPTGYVPRFLEELHDRGLEVNMALFQA